MRCPDPSQLANLLHNVDVTPSEKNLWTHLESCTACQEILNRISDDDDLARWRHHSRPTDDDCIETSRDNPHCKAMVDRLLVMETRVDSRDQRQTSEGPATESDLIAMLTTSPFDGDLGMLGEYRVRRRIGQGGMAFVVEAIDTRLDRTVALKILRSLRTENESKDRFLREAKSIAGVRHPNIIAIHGVANSPQGVPFIAMELMSGGSLQDRLRLGEPIGWKSIAEWIAQIADGLQAAHQAGLIHRDIKPSNILLSDDPVQTVKLADFGLARFVEVEHSMTQTGMLMGTPSYMSPEHIAAPESVDARSDVYCLGVTLYELLTGDVPFRGALHTLLQRIVNEEPNPPRTYNAQIPQDLETICMKGMHRDPMRRYATAREFASDLRRWLGDEPILARPTSTREKMIRWCRRNRNLALWMSVVGMLLIVLAAGSMLSALWIWNGELQLRDEKDKVVQANVAIQAASDDAKRQRQLAIDSLNSLVTKVQSTLASRPGTIELRSEILKTALQGLESITSDADAMSLEPTTIEAHIRQGEILDLLGRTSEAIVEFDTALRLANQAIERSSHDKQASIAYGNAWLARGDAHRKAFDYDQAKRHYDRALRMRTELAESYPEDVLVQSSLTTCMQRLAELQYFLQDWASAESSYEKLLAQSQAVANKLPDDPAAQRSLANAHTGRGVLAARLGALNLADEHFQESTVLLETRLARDPNNKPFRTELAYVIKQRAGLASQQGKHEEAIGLAKRALDSYRLISESDPSDTDARMRIGVGWDELATVQSAAGNFQAAAQALSSGLEIFAELTDRYPTAAKYPTLAMEACSKLVLAQVRIGQFKEGIESFHLQMTFAEKWQNSSDVGAQDFEGIRSATLRSIQTLEIAMAGVEACDAASDVLPDVRYAAKVLAAYELARIGEVERAMDVCDSLQSYVANDPEIGLHSRVGLVRVYVVCLAHVRKESAAEPSTENQTNHRRAVAGAAPILQSLLAINPAFKTFLKSEYDIAQVLWEPTMQELLGH